MWSVCISSFTQSERNERASQRAEERGLLGVQGAALAQQNWNLRFSEWEGRWPEAKS